MEGLRTVLANGGAEYFCNFDILLFVETFQLKETNLSNLGFYTVESLAIREGEGRPSGGILVACKPNLTPFNLTSHTEHIVVVETKSLNLICCYFSPTSNSFFIIEELTQKLVSVNLLKPTLVCGDFNARLDVENEKAELLLDLLKEFGFVLLNEVESPTYICHNGYSVIDLVFTNFLPCSVQVEHSSDVLLLRKHCPIKIKCDVLPEFQIQKSVEKVKKQRKIGTIDEEVLKRVEEQLLKYVRMDDAYEILCKGILDAVPNVKDITRFSRFKSSQIDKLKRELIQLHQRTQTRPLLLGYYARKKREYKESVALIKQQEKDRKEQERLQEAETLPWKLNPRRNGNVPCRISLSDWMTHFTHLYNAPANPELVVDHDYPVTALDEVDESWFHETEESEVLNRDFTEFEVENALNSCSNKKAVGPDEIANEHLKGSFSVLGHLWLMLFNFILWSGVTLECWRTSIVKVLYKGKGERNDPNSYRGIALLNHSYKWFSKLLARRIYNFVERNDSLPAQQFGFRKEKSTVQAFIQLSDYVKSHLAIPATPVFAVFVDFSKAFDMIPRRALIRKIALLHKIRGPILRVIMSLLEYNLIKVFDGVGYTDDILQLRGVQQGDSLSPLLFLLFVSDLPQVVFDVSDIVRVIMFADDLVMFSTSKKGIQKCLNELSRYCLKNRLEVNLGKTKVLKFRNGGKCDEVFFYNGKKIEVCNSYEYLGITVQTTWRFTKHLRKKRAKAIAASHYIRNLQLLSIKGATKYFSIMIEPIITYGIEAFWTDLSVMQLELIDGVWFDFFKKVLGVHRSTRNRKIVLLLELPTLVESLVKRGKVPITEAYLEYISRLEWKVASIETEFFSTPAMTQVKWKNGNCEKRHLVCRLASHGFHHKICFDDKCNNRCINCKCKFCFKSCESLNHAIECSVLKNKSLAYLDQL